MVKLHVSFGTNSSIEIEANNTHDLAVIVNKTVAKFFPKTTFAEESDF